VIDRWRFGIRHRVDGEWTRQAANRRRIASANSAAAVLSLDILYSIYRDNHKTPYTIVPSVLWLMAKAPINGEFYYLLESNIEYGTAVLGERTALAVNLGRFFQPKTHLRADGGFLRPDFRPQMCKEMRIFKIRKNSPRKMLRLKDLCLWEGENVAQTFAEFRLRLCRIWRKPPSARFGARLRL